MPSGSPSTQTHSSQPPAQTCPSAPGPPHPPTHHTHTHTRAPTPTPPLPPAVPGLDDLLLDASADNPLFADPFGSGLDLPWASAPQADPFEKPRWQEREQPQPAQKPQLEQVSATPAPPPVPTICATSAAAEQPVVLVPQQQVRQAHPPDQATSMAPPRSQAGIGARVAGLREPGTCVTGAAAAGLRRKSGSAKHGSRAAVPAAAALPLAPQPPQPRRQQEQRQEEPPVQHQRQTKQEQQQQQPQERASRSPARGPKRPLLAAPGPEAFCLPGISLPLPEPEQGPRGKPPLQRWLLSDASFCRPVKRGVGLL